MTSTPDSLFDNTNTIKSAFGSENRSRLIDEYFSNQPDDAFTSARAWEHVYRLLLWIDRTTGLAHCYESDKSQPGKRWYARSLAFHDWVSTALGVAPDELARNIDWLFFRAAEELATYFLQRAEALKAKAEKQRQPYDDRNFPRPGEDAELSVILHDSLSPYFLSEPPLETWNLLVQRIRQHFSLDNKRKNLVGEGFEDVVSHVIQRTCQDMGLHVSVRRALHDLPGFNRVRGNDKPNKVDISVIVPSRRILVTAKWSVRADREKQFETDFDAYVNAESFGQPFEYIFITNEFDPARLMRACEKIVSNGYMFKNVVHINTAALEAVYNTYSDKRLETTSVQTVLHHIKSGRLIGLEKWINGLTEI